jgi:hypothetical protein
LSSYPLSEAASQSCADRTDLDIEQHPYVLKARLRKILEKIFQTGQRLLRFLERLQLAQELIVTINDLLITTKAPFQILVLHDFSLIEMPREAVVLTCDSTTTPSLDK